MTLFLDDFGEEGGINLYGFGGNPIGTVDPFGLALYAFDGTNAEPADRKKGEESNVYILNSLYKGSAHYRPGVGTLESEGWEQFLGNVGGYGGTDRINFMFARLKENIERGDSVIHVIGFSRGAAMAREFLNLIHDEYPCLPIQWVGLFDTVASFGIGGNDIDIGFRLGIPDTVQRIFHLTAADEHRFFFPLASIRTGPNGSTRFRNWVEIAMPGAHSDVGGGYARRDLANVALMLMHYDGVRHGVPFGPIPPKYSAMSGREPHDSRWPDDHIAHWLYYSTYYGLIAQLLGADEKLPREVYYHP